MNKYKKYARILLLGSAISIIDCSIAANLKTLENLGSNDNNFMYYNHPINDLKNPFNALNPQQSASWDGDMIGFLGNAEIDFGSSQKKADVFLNGYKDTELIESMQNFVKKSVETKIDKDSVVTYITNFCVTLISNLGVKPISAYNEEYICLEDLYNAFYGKFKFLFDERSLMHAYLNGVFADVFNLAKMFTKPYSSEQLQMLTKRGKTKTVHYSTNLKHKVERMLKPGYIADIFGAVKAAKMAYKLSNGGLDLALCMDIKLDENKEKKTNHSGYESGDTIIIDKLQMMNNLVSAEAQGFKEQAISNKIEPKAKNILSNIGLNKFNMRVSRMSVDSIEFQIATNEDGYDDNKPADFSMFLKNYFVMKLGVEIGVYPILSEEKERFESTFAKNTDHGAYRTSYSSLNGLNAFIRCDGQGRKIYVSISALSGLINKAVYAAQKVALDVIAEIPGVVDRLGSRMLLAMNGMLTDANVPMLNNEQSTSIKSRIKLPQKKFTTDAFNRDLPEQDLDASQMM